MRFTTWHLECPCGWRGKSLQWNTDPFICAACGGEAHLETPAGRAPLVVPDEIPGGRLIPHAICHDDGTPKRYYSRTDINRALRDKGYCIEGETPKPKHDRWV
jgi:hypothetical protein